jgi:hypothetical protein
VAHRLQCAGDMMLKSSNRFGHAALAAAVWASVGCADGDDGFVDPRDVTRVSDLGVLAPGWEGEIVATVDQSYAGWDVEIGDADGDGQPEILTGSAPAGRVYLFRKRDGAWQSRRLLDRDHGGSGMMLGVRVVDLDGDGVPEVLAGSGEYDDSTAALHVFHTDGERVTEMRSLRAAENTSSYTHGLATADLNGDGIQEVISAYCGHGEVIRYDVTPETGELRARKVLQLSGSGEEAQIADVDGDGRPELIVSNGFRDGEAKVQIHDFDPRTGDPIARPRVVLDGYDGRGAFYASLTVGDLDGDGRPELIVAWKGDQDVNRTTLLAYHVSGTGAQVAYELAYEDPELDLAYFEKMMAIADIDGDGRAELYISTRGDGSTEDIESRHLGHVYMYQLTRGGEVRRGQIIDFDERLVQSSWLAVGDADGDGKPELVLATGRGDVRESGTSWVVALRKEP